MIQYQLNFGIEPDNNLEGCFWFKLFWKYVKKGSYQKFIRDLQVKKSGEEINEINLLIRKIYINFAKESFPELGNLIIDYDNSTIVVENEEVLKKIEPTYSRLLVGNHGIYIEFDCLGVNCEFVQKRLQYLEYIRNNFKLYHQFETVNYADYKAGKWYIDLYNAFGLDTPDYVNLIENKK